MCYNFLMKKTTILLLLAIFSFNAASHEAQKQTEPLIPEGLTQKWLNCESALEKDDPEEFQKNFEDFTLEVKKSKPSDTVTYYFPEAKTIYENILLGIRDGDNQKISQNVQNWEILQKNISRFQLQQLFYSYRILIAVIIILLLLALALFILYRFSSYSKKENKAFTRQMIQTQEAERERISNELHDTVCQDLRELQFRLEDEKTVELCKKIANDVRNTCYALTPSDLKEGIFEALISLCSMNQKDSNIKIILSIQEDIKNNPRFLVFSKEKSLNIYRIVQEILANAIKHAQAEAISVLIRSFDTENFRIIVSDDGKGFDLKTALKKKKHFGLKNIYTRAENMNATVTIKSEEGDGTQVTVTIPYK